MSNTDFTTVITTDHSPHEVFNAVCNVRAWWQGTITGNTEKLNDEFEYRMKEFHYSKQKLVEVIPDKKVAWLITESKLNFTQDKEEWTGTKIIFDIAEVNGKTELRFTHQGLAPKFECYKDCSRSWDALVKQSLLSLIETGKGIEVFK